MSKYRYYFRDFLNLPEDETTASVLAMVDQSGGTLKIADCVRSVTLNFPVWHKADRENTLFKARLLHGVLTDMIAALEAEASNWQALEDDQPDVRFDP